MKKYYDEAPSALSRERIELSFAYLELINDDYLIIFEDDKGDLTFGTLEDALRIIREESRYYAEDYEPDLADIYVKIRSIESTL